MSELRTPRDLGLNYEDAMHGVQSAIKFELSQLFEQAKTNNTNLEDFLGDRLKHMRVGIDASKSDACGLAALLIKKGVFTLDEYLEHMRLYMNEELARYEAHIQTTYGLPNHVGFR